MSSIVTPSSRMRRISFAERQALGGIHAGRRLVEREQLAARWRARARSRAGAGRRRAGCRRRRWRARGCRRSRAARATRFSMSLSSCRVRLVAQHRADHARTRAHVAPDHHVLERRQIGEQADVLEGARDAGGGDLVRLEPGERAAVERERARVGRVDPGQHVEQRRLAGAVRADQAVDLARRDGERHLVQRLHAAEALADAARPEGARSCGAASCGALLQLALSHRRGQQARPGGRASPAPAPGRRAACGSPRARSACGRRAPPAPA